MTPARVPGEPSWKWRRIVIFATCAYCAAMLLYMVNEEDTRVNESIAFSLATLLGVIIVGYTGFATAQDIAAIMATKSGTPYAPPEERVDPLPFEPEDEQRPPGGGLR